MAGVLQSTSLTLTPTSNYFYSYKVQMMIEKQAANPQYKPQLPFLTNENTIWMNQNIFLGESGRIFHYSGPACTYSKMSKPSEKERKMHKGLSLRDPLHTVRIQSS